MDNVIAFTPRPRPAAPAVAPPPLAGLALRAHLEEAAQVALDVADKIIAALDRLDGDADDEPDAEAEPSLAAPEGHASQIIWARGGDDDREAVTAEARLPTVAVEDTAPQGEPTAAEAFAPLPWRGSGNVVSAAGCAILALVVRA